MFKGKKADWRTRGSLFPGQKGTAKEYEQYGDKLIGVRYRYNAKTKRQIKTVEIIVSEKKWEPPQGD